MKVTELDPSRWVEYKELKLEALKVNPEAFSSFYDCDSKYPDGKWKNYLVASKERREGLALFGQAEDGKLIGMIESTFDINNPIRNHIAWIHTVYVSEEFRGCGVARELFKELESKLGVMGIKKLKLDVFIENDIAKELYSKSGFREVGVEKQEMNTKLGYRDLVLMEKLV